MLMALHDLVHTRGALVVVMAVVMAGVTNAPPGEWLGRPTFQASWRGHHLRSAQTTLVHSRFNKLGFRAILCSFTGQPGKCLDPAVWGPLLELFRSPDGRGCVMIHEVLSH